MWGYVMRRSEVIIVAVGVICMTLLTLMITAGTRRPLYDEFEVVANVPDVGTKRHAVTFRSNHQQPTKPLMFTLVGTTARQVGSYGLSDGQSALSWRGLPPSTLPIWIDGRLTLTIPNDTTQFRGSFGACGNEHSGPRVVCFDPALVTIRNK
jgi:hypothetical protein